MTKKEKDKISLLSEKVNELDRTMSRIELQLVSIRFALEGKATLTAEQAKATVASSNHQPTNLTVVSKGIQ